MRRTTRINLIFDKKFSKYQKAKDKMIKAADELEELVNSDEFADFILNHKFQGELGFADSAMTNEQIYTINMTSPEKLNGEIDYEWDIHVIPYWSRKRVIGYTYPSRNEIWVNMRYTMDDSWTVGDTAGNLSHEHEHKLGFKHSFRRSWKWPFTVPYAVGNWCKKMINKKHGKLTLEDGGQNTGYRHMGFFRRVWFKVVRIFS